jgi:hypothetical protein
MTIPPASEDMSTDIEKILRQVKLPERRDFRGTADPKQEIIPQKNLAAIVTKPPSDPSEVRAQLPDRVDSPAVSSVHTLKDDLQSAVKEHKMSLVRAVSLEQDKKRTELIEEDFGRKERHKRVFGILFATGLLFLLGFGALFGVYVVMMSHSATTTQQSDSLIFAEQSTGLVANNTTASEIKRRIGAMRQTQVGSLGSITRVQPISVTGDSKNPIQQDLTTQEFLKAAGINAPDELIRSLGSRFFLGLHVVDKNAPVFVFTVTNYDRAFAGMLKWESTMNADLAPIVTPVPAVVLDNNGIPSERIFKDDVMRNYDVRELKDDAGTVQLYYSFPSTGLLIIAESPYSFPEVLSRLQSVRKL